MKKQLTIGTYIVLSVLLFGTTASAETARINVDANAQVQIDMKEKRLDEMRERKETAQNTREDRREYRDEKQEERKEYRTENKEDRKETIAERIRIHAEWMTKRFNAAILRLEKLATRIDSRIAKVKAEGGTTTEAEGHMTTARTEIASAKAGMLKIQTELDLALKTTPLTKDSFKGLKALADTIKEDIRASHSAMVKAISSLKPGLNVQASTTAKTVQ